MTGEQGAWDGFDARLTLAELAEVLGVTEQQVTALLETGRLPARQLSGGIFGVRLAEVRELHDRIEEERRQT